MGLSHCYVVAVFQVRKYNYLFPSKCVGVTIASMFVSPWELHLYFCDASGWAEVTSATFRAGYYEKGVVRGTIGAAAVL